MRPHSLFMIAGALLAQSAHSQQLSYEDSIHALANGNFFTSALESTGDVWLNITAFAVDQLPFIQESVGITSLDNAQELQVIAGLAQTAASGAKWGDLVFLYNVFVMNAANSNVASPQMKEGLLEAVAGSVDPDARPEEHLVNLYASSSSSPTLEAAFRSLLE